MAVLVCRTYKTYMLYFRMIGDRGRLRVHDGANCGTAPAGNPNYDGKTNKEAMHFQWSSNQKKSLLLASLQYLVLREHIRKSPGPTANPLYK